MNPDFWYVVAGDKREHLDMAIVSALALRRIIPEASVCLACDSACYHAVEKADVDLSKIFDEVRQFEADYPTAFLRSRAIKIRLRLELTGDFIYLDSDVLVARPFSDLLPPDCHVAIALDAPEGIPGELIGGFERYFKKIGWPYPVERYFNCGVMLWRDDVEARALAENWLKNWEHSCQHGVELDQPAIAHSDRELGGIVTVLPPAMNLCPFKAIPEDIKSARIWHFWSHRLYSGTILHSLMSDFQRTNEMNFAALDQAIKRRRPWVREDNMGICHLARQGCWDFAIQEIPAAAQRLLRRITRRGNG